MLSHVCRLLKGQGRLALDDQAVEILGEQGRDRLRQIPDDLDLKASVLVENSQGPIFEDRVGI
jgi:hypothetical protein